MTNWLDRLVLNGFGMLLDVAVFILRRIRGNPSRKK